MSSELSCCRCYCSHPKHGDKVAAIYCSKCEKHYCSECVSMMHDVYFSEHTTFVTRVGEEEEKEGGKHEESISAQGPTLSSENCAWKECPDDVESSKKYVLDSNNLNVAIKAGTNGCWCTVIGNAALPSNATTTWKIKILNSRKNDCSGINVGVAPSDVDQNINWNGKSFGWYLNCYSSTLSSGAPQNVDNVRYGPRKGYGKYVCAGDSVGVVMDTTKGELSFILNNVNLGVAYEGIPLNKPLAPCVLLAWEGDSVELVI